MRRTIVRTCLCLCFVGAISCSDCEKRDENLLSLVPADAAGAVIFPHLDQTVRDVKALMDKLSVGPLAAFINQGHLELSRILGFDPLKLEDLSKLGLDPTRGLALVPSADQPLMVVGVADRKALEQEIAKRMEQLAAAEHKSSATFDGLQVTTISAQLGDRQTPRLHYAFVGDFVLLASPRSDPAALGRLAQLKKEHSLERAGWFRSLREKVPRQADLLLVLNPAKAPSLGSPLPAVARWVDQGPVLALSIDPNGLGADLFFGLEQKAAAKLNALSSAVTDVHLERYLPADTLLALKARIDTGKMLDELFGLDPGFKADFDQAMQAARGATGADLEQGSVRNLTGNLVVGLRLGAGDEMNRLLTQLAEKDADAQAPAAEQPEAFQLFFWAQIQDAAAWVQMVEQVLSMASDQFQVQVTKSSIGALKVIQLAGPQLTYTLYLLQQQDTVGGCLGTDCTRRAAELVAGERKALPARLSNGAKRLFDQPSLVVGYLNCAQLVDALSALDARVLGEGGVLAKVVLELVLTAVRNFRELTGVVRVVPDGVSVSGRLEIQ